MEVAEVVEVVEDVSVFPKLLYFSTVLYVMGLHPHHPHTLCHILIIKYVFII